MNRPSCRPRGGSVSHHRSIATRRWPFWRAATSPGTARPATATSPPGAACRSATPGQQLAAIADEVVEHEDGLVALDVAPQRAPALPAPRLLGPFDPVLHGWASRAELVGDHAGIVTTNGLFRPVALVSGRAVATWGLANGVVTIRPLEAIAGPNAPRPGGRGGRRPALPRPPATSCRDRLTTATGPAASVGFSTSAAARSEPEGTRARTSERRLDRDVDGGPSVGSPTSRSTTPHSPRSCTSTTGTSRRTTSSPACRKAIPWT